MSDNIAKPEELAKVDYRPGDVVWTDPTVEFRKGTYSYGSNPEALKYLDLGFRLGFGGMLTFERSTKLRALARELPLEGIVLETDAPDMTVAAHRGERNSPAYLRDVLSALAQVRGQDPGMVAAETTRNARNLLGI